MPRALGGLAFRNPPDWADHDWRTCPLEPLTKKVVRLIREERPDVDAIYMDAVQALTGRGGWPMTAFLTPTGEPFYGGTYFPDRPRHGIERRRVNASGSTRLPKASPW